jgi:N-acetylneuraminic acid mutarotase
MTHENAAGSAGCCSRPACRRPPAFLAILLLIAAVTAGDPSSSLFGDTLDCEGTWGESVQANPPEPRSSHTAVWTGTEMIIWGGFNGSTYLNSGGRFDPTTGTWTPTSTINAPFARTGHSAVWTGSEMIVWGGMGYGTNDETNTGGRYNPMTDTWWPLSTAGSPQARRSHSAVWTGSEMIVWGGVGGALDLNSGGRWNPVTDTWGPIADAGAPIARFDHTAVWTGARMIVWGGYHDVNEVHPLDSGGEYDAGANTWTATEVVDAPSGRGNHSAVWTGSEMIVWGGWNGMPLDSGSRYDPATGTWLPTAMTGAPQARAGHGAFWTGAEMILWGGGGGTFGAQGLDTGGRFDPTADAWSPTSTLNAPEGRGGGTVVWTGREMIVWGGYHDRFLDSMGRYTPGHDARTDGDVDADLIGDVCDLDDGLILVRWRDESTVGWQQETGVEAFNLYRGDLSLLQTSGLSTQDPAAVPLAGRECGLLDTGMVDSTDPPPGKGVFFLVTGIHLGMEGSLGVDSSGTPRSNPHPCP